MTRIYIPGPDSSGDDASERDRLISLREDVDSRRTEMQSVQKEVDDLRQKRSMLSVNVSLPPTRKPGDPKTDFEISLEKCNRQLWQKMDEYRDKKLAYEHALDQYLISTIKPRVESSKLVFEVHKLRATICAGSLVGIGAVASLLLPENPSSPWLLALAFASLLASMALTVGIMERHAGRVEEALAFGREANEHGWKTWVARMTFPLGITLFAVFAVINFALG